MGEGGVARPGSAAESQAARQRALERLHSQTWPPGLLAVLERLSDGGHRAWLVGGTVRDVALGRAFESTFDVSTDLTPDQVTARFERVEPIGIRHGTVLILDHDLAIECTTLRREGGYRDARHPDSVEFTTELEEDLARRDLTVNAMAFSPSGELVDPYGGAWDLEQGCLRAVGDPLERFREDALRPLRVARLAAVLDMEPEPATRAALGAVLDRAPQVAWERVRQELEKLLEAERPSIGFEILRQAGLLALWLPELSDTYGVAQNRHHAYDVYRHSLETCDAAPREKPLVRWAALLHDIGKPATRVERHGDWTFYQHERVGAELADRALERLRFPGEARRAIVHLVREHMFDYRTEWSDGALRRWLKRVGVEQVADLFDLRIADYLGNGLKQGFPAYLEEMRMRIEALLVHAQALSVRDLAVSGAEVMTALEVKAGPAVGEALEALLEVVLEDPGENSRERLLARLDEWRREGRYAREPR